MEENGRMLLNRTTSSQNAILACHVGHWHYATEMVKMPVLVMDFCFVEQRPRGAHARLVQRACANCRELGWHTPSREQGIKLSTSASLLQSTPGSRPLSLTSTSKLGIPGYRRQAGLTQ
eukprot:167330-Rhodomonas_salina.2